LQVVLAALLGRESAHRSSETKCVQRSTRRSDAPIRLPDVFDERDAVLVESPSLLTPVVELPKSERDGAAEHHDDQELDPTLRELEPERTGVDHTRDEERDGDRQAAADDRGRQEQLRAGAASHAPTLPPA
jgi:hypothetical protein